MVSREEVLHELEAVTDRIAEAEGEAREVEIQQRQISYSQVIEFHSQAGVYIMKNSMYKEQEQIFLKEKIAFKTGQKDLKSHKFG